MKIKKYILRTIASALSVLCLITSCNLGLTISAFAEEDMSVSNSATAPEEYIPQESIDEITTFSLRHSAEDLSSVNVLLVEDTLPWNSSANSTVLTSLGVSYNKVKTDDFLSQDLGDYSVLIFANDQQFSTYSNYANFMSNVETFASLGGVVIFGACDAGWANGTITTALPGGVSKATKYTYNNYISDSVHPIVTGELIDDVALVDSDLYSYYCSHTYFIESTLPEGSNVILRDESNNAPTLVEYNIGSGTVIASGLTWEHSYAYHIDDSYGHYAQKAMADMFMYAISISNANVNMRPPVALSVMGDEDMLSDAELNVSAIIENIGEDKAENVRLWLVRPNELDFAESSDERILTWDILDVDESEQVDWVLKLKDNVTLTEPETYVDIGIKLEYTIPETGETEQKEIIKQVKIIRNNKAIVVVPGIMGSNLVKTATNEVVWGDWMMSAGDISDIPVLHDAFQSLECDETGRTWYTLEAQNDYGYGDVYKGIITSLENDSTISDEYDIKFFPYDWRKGVNNIAEELNTFIDGYDDVIFVAHSMGGLVTERYLAYYGDDKVSKQITAGTPFWGTPAMLSVLDEGNLGYIMDLDWTAQVFTSLELPSILKNLGSCYDLLPSEEYTTDSPWLYEYRRVFENWYDIFWYNGDYFYYTFDEFDEVISDNYNGYLWEYGKMDHYQIDISQSNTSDLKRIALVGAGHNTISDIEVTYYEGENMYIPRYSIGDGVVTITSSTMNFNRDLLDMRIFYDANHMGLIQNESCIEEIINEIKADMNINSRMRLMSFQPVSETADSVEMHNVLNNQLAISGEFEFSAKNESSEYSYTSIGVVDGNTFKINPISAADINIILAQFSEADFEFTFTSLKEQLSDIVLVLNDDKYLYRNVTVYENSIIYLDLTDTTLVLNIDFNGDGKIDNTITPNSDYTPSDDEPSKNTIDFTVESRNANVSNTNTINPNVVLTNNSDEAVNLSELTISYIFNPDEKENFEFHCDWLAVNNQYIGDVAECEFIEQEDGNIFATISFNTDVIINSSEQLVIHFRINSSDWANLDFANDYSMGTELVNITDRIIITYNDYTYGVLPE